MKITSFRVTSSLNRQQINNISNSKKAFLYSQLPIINLLTENFQNDLDELEHAIFVRDLAASVFLLFAVTFPLEQVSEGQDWCDDTKEAGLEGRKRRLEVLVMAYTHSLKAVHGWIELKTIWRVEII